MARPLIGVGPGISIPDGVITYEEGTKAISEEDPVSPEIEAKGMKWAIGVGRYGANAEYLGLFLLQRRGNYEALLTDVIFEMKLISSIKENVVTKQKEFTFKDFDDAGFSNFIEWENLIEDGNGFIKNNKITVECRFWVKKLYCFRKIDVFDFTQPTGSEREVTFLVNGEKFYANKGILETISPFFDKLFNLKGKKTKEIELKDIDCKEFLQFLQFIHPPHEITEDNVNNLIKLCHHYGIKAYRKSFEEFVIKSTKLTVAEKLVLSDNYTLVNLMRHCIDQLKTLKDIQDLGDLGDFQEGIKEEILRKLHTINN